MARERARLRAGRAAAVGATVLLLIVSGCAAWEPFEPELPREIPDGPGLLTGPQGAFVIERPIGAGTPAAGGEEEGDEVDDALRPERGRP